MLIRELLNESARDNKSGVTPLTYMAMINRTFGVKSNDVHQSGRVDSHINGFNVEADYNSAADIFNDRIQSVTIWKDHKKISELKPATDLSDIKEFLQKNLK